MKILNNKLSFFFPVVKFVMDQALRIKKKRFRKKMPNNFLYLLNINQKKNCKQTDEISQQAKL